MRVVRAAGARMIGRCSLGGPQGEFVLLARTGLNACSTCRPRMYRADPTNTIVHPAYIPFRAAAPDLPSDDELAARAEVCWSASALSSHRQAREQERRHSAAGLAKASRPSFTGINLAMFKLRMLAESGDAKE